jgi:hypothetical protein
MCEQYKWVYYTFKKIRNIPKTSAIWDIIDEPIKEAQLQRLNSK